MKKILTLALVHQHPQILLGLKKRGIGFEKWNGFGGKVEPGETIEAAAIRELREESGIIAKNIAKRGIIEFNFEKGSEVLEVHIFHVTEYEGDPLETEEMTPRWFNVDEIPFENMWADDIHWMPYFLEGKNFRAKFVLESFSNSNTNKIISMDLQEVNGF